MAKLTRRALLSSITSSILFAAGPASALVCDVRRSKQGGVSTKSYTCRMAGGQSLTATFIRMSDMVADTIGQQQLPSEYDALLAGSQLIETPALDTFETLLRQYSYAIEPYDGMQMTVDFDGREDGIKATSTDFPAREKRFRTLGAWDDLEPDSLPFFPLPDELRRALSAPNEDIAEDFLRYATQKDFQRLPEKKREYTKLWREQAGQIGKEAQLDDLGNLDLMKHIGAWKVQGFLPLYFSTVYQDDCTSMVYGGAHYVPPALYVDAMVCRNTGTSPLRIDDFFGAADEADGLRPYSPATPPGVRTFGWRSVELAPGESIVAVQRLTFAAFDQDDPQTNSTRSFARAIYGPTQLPKGFVMGGERYPFEGRSHNALIVGSYAGRGSCPYLSSWCDQAQEWVHLGKVITECNSPEREGEDCREFHDLRTRFKLVEREHEQTTLRSVALEIETQDGDVIHLPAPDSVVPESARLPVTLDIGQMVEFAFTLPKNVRPTDVVKTRLRLRGYYQYYLQEDFERCKELASR